MEDNKPRGGLAQRLCTARNRLMVFTGIWRAETWPDRIQIVRYSISSAILPLLRRFGIPSYWITLRGRRFLIEPGRGELAAYLEVWLDRAYERHPEFRVEAGWFVVDVGANAGFFSILQASRGATVVAIEPNPLVVSRLERAVGANDFGDRVTVVPCAAGRRAQEGRIRFDRNTVQGMVSLGGDDEEGSRVAVRPLDDILREQPRRIDLLKIDTEGAECEVVLGSREVLERTERVVLEFHSDALHRAVRELLAASNFGEILVTGPIAYFLRRPLVPESQTFQTEMAPSGPNPARPAEAEASPAPS